MSPLVLGCRKCDWTLITSARFWLRPVNYSPCKMYRSIACERNPAIRPKLSSQSAIAVSTSKGNYAVGFGRQSLESVLADRHRPQMSAETSGLFMPSKAPKSTIKATVMSIHVSLSRPNSRTSPEPRTPDALPMPHCCGGIVAKPSAKRHVATMRHTRAASYAQTSIPAALSSKGRRGGSPIKAVRPWTTSLSCVPAPVSVVRMHLARHAKPERNELTAHGAPAAPVRTEAPPGRASSCMAADVAAATTVLVSQPWGA
mmetsp:Transcript_40232/g.107920  ORF Transcript_40232/g.107920 Transcript_40232/m.107920 type:complete len:258 (+) Transcript_40232:164-937(+)